jgi:hypothetical protein
MKRTTALRMRVGTLLVTFVMLVLVARRVPLGALVAAFRGVDYARFLALMVVNTLFYFCWDTLLLSTVIRWFHKDVRYRDLLSVRAASYVLGFFNTNAGRGGLAAYLWRRLGSPFLELGSTVIFLVLTEYTQLVLWAMLGIFIYYLGLPTPRVFVQSGVGAPGAAFSTSQKEITTSLLPVAGLVAALWAGFFVYMRLHVKPRQALAWLFAPRDWQLFRTFRQATVSRYVRIVALRAPMFLVSLWAHYYGAHAFGIYIPFGPMLTFLPVIFMAAALPINVAHLGTTQAAWIFFFGQYAPAPRLLAFSLAAHLTFTITRALLGLGWLPIAFGELTAGNSRREPALV